MNTCSINECTKPTRTSTSDWCAAHYHRWYRYGDPQATAPSRRRDLTGQRFGTLTVLSPTPMGWLCVCDCGGTRDARVFALTNQPNPTCSNTAHRRTATSYEAAHDRLRADRGPASNYACVDCGRPALHWSYNHDDPAELISDVRDATGCAYSMDPNSYSPRCVPCHKRFDIGYINSTYGR